MSRGKASLSDRRSLNESTPARALAPSKATQGQKEQDQEQDVSRDANVPAATQPSQAVPGPESKRRTSLKPGATAVMAGCRLPKANKELLQRWRHIQAGFAQYDTSGDGVLDGSEFDEFVKATLAAELKAADAPANFCDQLMRAIDVDGSGTIGLSELRGFMRVYDPIEKQLKTRSALIIIDVQNDFVSGSLANSYDAAAMIPAINDMRGSFDLVVISYDWHPHDHCSFVESVNAGVVALAGDHEPTAVPVAPFSEVTHACGALPTHLAALYHTLTAKGCHERP